MSTRSRIGIVNKDGTVRSIYCHFDGYPEGVGETLRKHYNTPEKINELLDLGDISTLGEFYEKDLAEEKWEHGYEKGWSESERGQRAAKMTLPYSDRGENVPARIDESEVEFLSKLGKCGEDYTYLFDINCRDEYEWRFCKTPWMESLDFYLDNKD